MTKREFYTIEQVRDEAKLKFNRDFESSKDLTDLVHTYARYCGRLEALLDTLEVKALERGLR